MQIASIHFRISATGFALLRS